MIVPVYVEVESRTEVAQLRKKLKDYELVIGPALEDTTIEEMEEQIKTESEGGA